jgi:acyl-CoA hydrolase
MKVSTAADAAAQLRAVDSLTVPLGPGQPMDFLDALGERHDWQELVVSAGLLVGFYSVFTRPGVALRSGFFGPIERALREAGHDVSFIPGDFRRFKLIAERTASRVVATAASRPDSDGWLSLSLHAGATVEEVSRSARDPKRVLVVEANSRLPRTFGLGDHPHRVHVDDVDVLIESERDPTPIPDTEPNDVERAIADRVREFAVDGATLQTGIGGVPNAVAGLLAHGSGGDYGIHSEMFTTGLMQLHRAGKVSNRRKGIFDGYSVTTLAMGTRELYEWLHECPDVRFLPVEQVNTPAVIACNRNMLSINGALLVDLYGQVIADTIDGRQYSGIGGHEDFTSGASLEADDRSLICLPSTVEVGGERRSRIESGLASGSVVTTPRHNLDVVVTEYGAAQVAGLSIGERARALAEIAHPDFRDALMADAERLAAR